MNFDLLIDNIVRQTTVLIAQLATAAGGRAPLAHIAGQVFLSLVAELKDQGLGNKVIADMFGLALRTYHNRVRRYSESATDRGVSLWEAVLAHLQEHDTLTRSELFARFHRDDEAVLRGVLKDLVDSGLAFRSGQGDRTMFRAAPVPEAGEDTPRDPNLGAQNLLWVVLHQLGPSSSNELAHQLALTNDVVERALGTLLGEGRVSKVPPTSGSHAGDEPLYEAEHCVIPFGDEHGWEAALFDHYQAMVTAIAAKVRSGATRSRQDEAIGGSTYHFDLYPGHPLEDEVHGLLAEVRRRVSDLRTRVNDNGEERAGERYRVVFYAGQNLVGFPSQRQGVEE